MNANVKSTNFGIPSKIAGGSEDESRAGGSTSLTLTLTLLLLELSTLETNKRKLKSERKRKVQSLDFYGVGQDEKRNKNSIP